MPSGGADGQPTHSRRRSGPIVTHLSSPVTAAQTQNAIQHSKGHITRQKCLAKQREMGEGKRGFKAAVFRPSQGGCTLPTAVSFFVTPPVGDLTHETTPVIKAHPWVIICSHVY